MKHIALLPFIGVLALPACGVRNTEVIEYRQVTPIVTKQCCTRVTTSPSPCYTQRCTQPRCNQCCTSKVVVNRPRCCQSLSPVVYDPISLADPEPVNIATTSFEYY
ncbi:MAG: hypothetical protein H2069_09300 [Legionella sp.]|nr:hypothetical protein [Legionella sp.]